jgi:hypothetical protein
MRGAPPQPVWPPWAQTGANCPKVLSMLIVFSFISYLSRPLVRIGCSYVRYGIKDVVKVFKKNGDNLIYQPSILYLLRL